MPNYKIEVYRSGSWRTVYNSWASKIRINGKDYVENTNQVPTTPNFRSGSGNFRKGLKNFR